MTPNNGGDARKLSWALSTQKSNLPNKEERNGIGNAQRLNNLVCGRGAQRALSRTRARCRPWPGGTCMLQRASGGPIPAWEQDPTLARRRAVLVGPRVHPQDSSPPHLLSRKAPRQAKDRPPHSRPFRNGRGQPQLRPSQRQPGNPPPAEPPKCSKPPDRCATPDRATCAINYARLPLGNG